jgi:hypothetical protein
MDGTTRRLASGSLLRCKKVTLCARCGDPMVTTEPLDLDHNDDRTGYLGLSHRSCNRGSKRRVEPLPPRSCPVCGGHKPSSKQATCSRTCGWEWRRLNAA